MVTRIVLYSHDSIGLGHVRRNLAIAHALSLYLPSIIHEPVSGLLVTGQSAATSFPTPAGWDWLVLPGITTGVDGYRPRHLTLGIDTMTSIRAGILRVALREFAPDLLIVDRHALGARRELESALVSLRATRPECAIVLGLREVLDRPSVALAEWRAIGGATAIRRLFDALWVYGDPRVHNAFETGEIPSSLLNLAVHTGYLAIGRPIGHVTSDSEPFILTTVGGGSDGHRLASAAARAIAPPGYRHLVVTGPQMPDAHHAEIMSVAREGTSILRSVPDALALLRRAAAVVCMGGYNSISEAMTTAAPTLVVPREARRQEQSIRAAALARRGLVETVTADTATPAFLSAWFAANVGRVVPRSTVNLDGLETVAVLAAALLNSKQRVREPAEVQHAV